jgi:hypothetical protein
LGRVLEGQRSLVATAGDSNGPVDRKLAASFEFAPIDCLDLLIPGQLVAIGLASPCKKAEDSQRISSDPARPY